MLKKPLLEHSNLIIKNQNTEKFFYKKGDFKRLLMSLNH